VFFPKEKLDFVASWMNSYAVVQLMVDSLPASPAVLFTSLFEVEVYSQTQMSKCEQQRYAVALRRTKRLTREEY